MISSKQVTPKIPRGVTMMFCGLGAIVILFALYAHIATDSGNIVPDAAEPLYRFGYAFYILLGASLTLVAAGLYKYHVYMTQPNMRGLIAVIARHTNNAKSRKVFVATFVAYGIFFSLTSGTLVYQPEITFSYHYGVQVPSAEMVVCCDGPGYVPRILVYITEHVGLQIVPVNLVLQIVVSYMVALNVAIAIKALAISRAQRSMLGVGAVTGLFIACPTCVGTLASAFVGVASGITLSVALAQLQTGLIAISIPVLALTPFLLARRLARTPSSC